MSPKEINRTTLNRFLVRAIGHAWANAIDAEFGLRVRDVSTAEGHAVCIEFEGGAVAVIDTHLTMIEGADAGQT